MKRELKILFTSDTHGYLYPTDYIHPGDAEIGLMRLCTNFAPDGNTLILDGGDTLQGSPMTNLYYRLSREEQQSLLGVNPFAAMMNIAGYQYVTLGNHDFNHGLDVLGIYLEQLHARCLCCNIRDKAHLLPVAPYAIHTLENGLKIGLVGACTDYVSKWEDPAVAALLDIREPVEACRKALAEIRDQCDVTVLMYHGGFECSLEDGHSLTDSTENQACRICNELDFDIVLTGHQHMSTPCRKFGNSYVTQPAYRAMDACKLLVTVDDTRPLQVQGEMLRANGPVHTEAANLLQSVQDRTNTWLDTPAGHLDQPLIVRDHLTMAVEGCPLSNFINTVQRELSGAQISTNAMANEVQGLPKDVTIRNVVSAYIYANTLVVLDMTVRDLKRYMERSVAYFAKDANGALCISDDFLLPKVQHYNYDYFSGVDHVYDLRNAPGSRVISVAIDGRELADDEHVTVCINTYRHNGTGGYEFMTEQPVVKEVQVDVADAIIEYLLTHNDIHVDMHKYCTIIR